MGSRIHILDRKCHWANPPAQPSEECVYLLKLLLRALELILKELHGAVEAAHPLQTIEVRLMLQQATGSAQSNHEGEQNPCALDATWEKENLRKVLLLRFELLPQLLHLIPV